MPSTWLFNLQIIAFSVLLLIACTIDEVIPITDVSFISLIGWVLFFGFLGANWLQCRWILSGKIISILLTVIGSTNLAVYFITGTSEITGYQMIGYSLAGIVGLWVFLISPTNRRWIQEHRW